MKKLTMMMTMVAMASMGACGDDDRPGDIILPDSGPGADTGPGGIDMGPGGSDMGGGPTGPCADPVPALPGDFFPRCSSATFDCAAMAADGTALQSCLNADTTPPYMGMMGANCSACYTNQLIFCADSMGCHAQWAGFNCCAEANGCADAACIEANCSAEQGAFIECLNGLPMGACNDLIVSCFEM